MLFSSTLYRLIYTGCLLGIANAAPSQRQVERANHSNTLTARTPASGWSLVVQQGNDGGGCYVDHSDKRLFSAYVGNDPNNGLVSCLGTCQLKGHKYGGVQYGDQCYCSDELPSDLQSALADECDAICPSDNNDKCGGPWRMNIYSMDGTYTPTGVTVSDSELKGCYQDGDARALTGYAFVSDRMTAEMCVNECTSHGYILAGVQNARECFCGNAFFNGLGQPIDTNRCDRQCSGDGGSNCGGWWTMSVYAQKNPSQDLPEGWTPKGCYGDSDQQRVLTIQSESPDMTASTCLQQCQKAGTKYAGVEGTECYCGNDLGLQLNDGRCSAICGGGGSSGCGGSWALSLYENTNPSSSSSDGGSAPSPTSNATPQGWNYVYCGTDADQRALSQAYIIKDKAMTINRCLTFCGDQDYKIGGIENGGECWCGDSLQNSQGTQTSDQECSSQCSGDQSQGQCGGQYRISLFTTMDEASRASVFTSAANTASSSVSASATSQTSQSSSMSTSAADTASSSASSSASSETGQSDSTSSPSGSAPPYMPTLPISGTFTKSVWANLQVSNTNSFTSDTWLEQIRMAHDNGIDGFVLNFGGDDWQKDRIKDAYNAAKDSQTGFKMMLSYDFSVLTCGDDSPSDSYRQLLKDYLYHEAAAQVDGKQALSSYTGQDCTFGQASVNDGWSSIFGEDSANLYFMPSFIGDQATVAELNLRTEVNWDAAWRGLATRSR